jgi:hypothetical protein
MALRLPSHSNKYGIFASPKLWPQRLPPSGGICFCSYMELNCGDHGHDLFFWLLYEHITATTGEGLEPKNKNLYTGSRWIRYGKEPEWYQVLPIWGLQFHGESKSTSLSLSKTVKSPNVVVTWLQRTATATAAAVAVLANRELEGTPQGWHLLPCHLFFSLQTILVRQGLAN